MWQDFLMAAILLVYFVKHIQFCYCFKFLKEYKNKTCDADT